MSLAANQLGPAGLVVDATHIRWLDSGTGMAADGSLHMAGK